VSSAVADVTRSTGIASENKKMEPGESEARKSSPRVSPNRQSECGRRLRSLGWKTLLSCIVHLVCFQAASASAAQLDRIVNFDIPSQPLNSALITFARQAEIQLAIAPDATDDPVVPEVKGAIRARKVLDTLLRNTGLQYATFNDTVNVIRRRDSAASTSAVTGPEGAGSAGDQASASVTDHREHGALSGSSGGGLEAANNRSAATLEEVLVTAERRTETIQTVPISITAYSQKMMDDLHVQSFSDLVALVPGLDIQQAENQGNDDIAIRGMFSGGNAPTTALYIDETAISIRELTGAGPSGSFFPDLFDLERVEVLRGPQGTLFGSSAMGGAIRFITPQPSLEQTSGYTKAEASYTERGAPSYGIGVAYGAPLVEGVVGYRVSGWFHSDGGFVDVEDPFTGKITEKNANYSTAYTFRPALTVAPTAGLTITPALFIQHQYSNAPSQYWAGLLPNPEPGKHIAGEVTTQPLWDDIKVPSLAIKYQWSNGLTFHSDTSYLDRWYDNIPEDTQILEAGLGGAVLQTNVPPSYAVRSEQRGGTKAWQQEFRLTSPEDGAARVSWVAGAYFRRAEETLSQLISPDLSPLTEAFYGMDSQDFFGVPDYVYGGQTLNSYTRFTAVDEQKALFGEVSIKIVAALKASAGVRVEHSVVEQQNQVVAGPLNGVTYSDVVLPDAVQTPVTPRFALTYQVTDQDMVYASAAKGYRAGGGNSATSIGNDLCTPSLTALGLTSVPKAFNSDGVWSYEVGSKDSVLDGHLVTQASVFYIDWSNIQRSVNLPSCSEVFTGNRGKATIQGFDLQLAAAPIEGVKLGASVGYTDAYFPNALHGAPNKKGIKPLLTGAGDKLAGVPPWTVALNAEYSWSIEALWGGARSYIRADYRRQSASPEEDPHVVSYDPALPRGVFYPDAFSTLNVRLGATRGGLDVSAFVNNLTHADPRTLYYHVPPADLFYASPIRPLTAGVTAYYRF
jgi:iron complex outermembrane recepter protein